MSQQVGTSEPNNLGKQLRIIFAEEFLYQQLFCVLGPLLKVSSLSPIPHSCSSWNTTALSLFTTSLILCNLLGPSSPDHATFPDVVRCSVAFGHVWPIQLPVPLVNVGDQGRIVSRFHQKQDTHGYPWIP